MTLLKKALFLTCIYFFITILLAHSLEDMQRLIDEKKNNYNKKLRPMLNQSMTTAVYMNMELLTIQEFDEVEEKFSVGAFVNMVWRDDLLTWDPKDYGGMGGFPSEVGDFWRPPIILVNPFNDIDSIGKDWNIFRYNSNGIVHVSPGHIFEASCRIDVTFYPWDQQLCYLAFNSWGFIADEVMLISTQNTIGTGLYGGHGTWDLVDTRAEHSIDENNSSLIVFSFLLNRKPLFVLVNVILPIVFMSFLNMLVFWIPTESGERISYCLTVLLAIAVFLTLVGDNLPKKSEPMCLLSFYLLGILVLSLFIVLATICNLVLYFRDERKPIPLCLAVLARCCACQCKRQQNYRYDAERSNEDDQQIFDISRSKTKRSMSNNRNSRGYKPNGYLAPSYNNSLNWRFYPYQANGVHEMGSSSSSGSVSRRRRMDSSEDNYNVYSDSDADDKISWKDVSFAFDVIFFLFCFCSLITTTAVYFATVLGNKQ